MGYDKYETNVARVYQDTDEDNIKKQPPSTGFPSRQWESAETDKLDAALAKAQGEMPDIIKTHEAKVTGRAGGQYSYLYATCSDVFKAVLPVLSKHGIAVKTRTEVREGKMLLYMKFVHSGQWWETEWPIAAHGEVLNQQTLGANTSYARKYSLCTMAGVAPEEDDLDGIDIEVALPPQPKAKPKNEVIRNPKDEISGTRPLPPRIGGIMNAETPHDETYSR